MSPMFTRKRIGGMTAEAAEAVSLQRTLVEENDISVPHEGNSGELATHYLGTAHHIHKLTIFLHL